MQRPELSRGECVISEWLSFLNRSRGSAGQEAGDAEQTEEPKKAPARRTRSRRNTSAGQTAEEAPAETTAEASQTSEATSSDETSAEQPAGGRGRRSRSGSSSTRGRGRSPKADEAQPDQAEAASPEPEVAAANANGAGPAAEAEAEAPTEEALVQDTPVEDKPRRRSRGSRGGARRRKDPAQAPAAEATPRTEAPARQQHREAAPPRTEAPARPQRREAAPPARGNSVEALIARQNVLFEDFTQQQTQTLRELQRSVRGIGGAQGNAGNLLALPKVGVFLDVPNLIYAAEQMGVRVDFAKLLDYLTEGRQLVRATAYAPITDDPLTRFEAQRFVAPVIHRGYKIVTKSWKRFADGSMKANFDIELAVDILTMSDRLDIVVLLSGDGDFRRVCELVESKGVRVEVVSFAQSSAKELRDVADQYTDLGSILDIVGG